MSRLPANIRVVSGQRGSPRDVDILDATTGERVQGVFKVEIDPSADVYTVTVYATKNWPIVQQDQAVNLTPDELEGATLLQGLVVEKRVYWMKSIQLETMGVLSKTELPRSQACNEGDHADCMGLARANGALMECQCLCHGARSHEDAAAARS